MPLPGGGVEGAGPMGLFILESFTQYTTRYETNESTLEKKRKKKVWEGCLVFVYFLFIFFALAFGVSFRIHWYGIK